MGNARRRPNSRTAGTDTSAIKTAKLHPLIATMWPTPVAAFEELVGSHGGLGGEQTNAFLVHPSDVQVPETKNSADVFPVLNARRGQLDERAQQRNPAPFRETGFPNIGLL